VSAAFAPDALDGQRALLTGGGRGIGEAIARQLASMGAEALIADLDGEAAARVAAEIVECGGPATAQVLDLGDLDRRAATRSVHCPDGAAKAAMEVVTKVTALERGPRGVRSNGVAPTFVPTERNRPVWDRVGFSESSSHSNPLGRIAAPGDIAGTVGWLVSDAAEYVNVQIITVDGGSGAGVFIPPSP
jgi:NAD(P)-dependent dehydrogenase (short-subunit alcohol dehydrogenase family)